MGKHFCESPLMHAIEFDHHDFLCYVDHDNSHVNSGEFGDANTESMLLSFGHYCLDNNNVITGKNKFLYDYYVLTVLVFR